MISVVILTKNCQATILRTLHSTLGIDEVIILDTGSTDQTLNIAKKFPHVKIFSSPFTTFGSLRNLAASYAKNNWILSLDSDEVLSFALKQILLTLKPPNDKAIYSFPFKNFFNGKHIKWCGWHPDRHTRLYNKTKTAFSLDEVHEKISNAGCQEIELKAPIHHFSYRSISDFLTKMDLYSTLFAKQYTGKKSSSFKKALFHGAFAFIKSYILKQGFLGGSEGFIISLYNSQTAFYKYLKLKERNKNASNPSLSPNQPQ